MSSRQRIGLIAAAVAVAVVAFVALRPQGDGEGIQPRNPPEEVPEGSTPRPGSAAGSREPERKPSPGVARIKVEDGTPVGGVERLELSKGDDVRFEVSSETPEEVHVHGYDVFEEVGPRKEARFDFPAELEGIFEVELEGSHTQIAELRVSP